MEEVIKSTEKLTLTKKMFDEMEKTSKTFRAGKRNLSKLEKQKKSRMGLA